MRFLFSHAFRSLGTSNLLARQNLNAGAVIVLFERLLALVEHRFVICLSCAEQIVDDSGKLVPLNALFSGR